MEKFLLFLLYQPLTVNPQCSKKVNKLFSNQGKRDYEKKNGKVKQYQKQGNN